MDKIHSDDLAPVTATEVFRQLLIENRAQEPGLVLALVGDIPEEPGFVALLCNLINEIKGTDGNDAYEQAIQLILSTQSAPHPHTCFKVESINGATVTAVVEALNKLDERTAVIITHIEDVWVQSSENSEALTASSWAAEKMKIQTAKQRSGTSVIYVLRALVAVAIARKLLIAVTCHLPANLWNDLDKETQSLDGLAFAAITSSKEDNIDQRLLQQIKSIREGTKSRDEVQQELEEQITDVKARTHAWAQVLSALGQHHEAWQSLKPILFDLKSEPISHLIRIAQMALDALEIESALEWLNQARLQGLRFYGDWCNAILIAQTVGDKFLEETLMTEMTKHFPDEPGVLDYRLRKLIADGEFGLAADVAEKLNAPTRALILRKIAKGNWAPNDFLQATENNNEDRAFAFQAAAIDAERRAARLPGGRSQRIGILQLAQSAAKRVPASTSQYILSLILRWRVWGKIVMDKNSPEDSDGTELQQLLRDSAPYGDHVELRHIIDEVCVDGITPTANLIVFAFIIPKIVIEILNDIHDKPWNFITPTVGPEADAEKLVPLWEGYLSKLKGSTINLDGPGLQKELAHHATPEIMRSLMRMPQMVSYDSGDWFGRIIVMKMAEIVSRQLNDPTADNFVALSMIRSAAMGEDAQVARNLAEEVMRALPGTQPEFRLWRMGLAWLIMADSRLSSGSALEALRFIALALSAMRGHIVDAELVAELINMCARCFRDMKLIDLSKMFLNNERMLRERFNQTHLIGRIDGMELMLAQKELSFNALGKAARLLHKVLNRLRVLHEKEEPLPLIAIAANCYRILRLSGHIEISPVAGELLELAKQSFENHPRRGRIIHFLLEEKHTRVSLIEGIEAVTNVVRAEDLDGQLSQMRLIAEDAFALACDTDDFELAITSAAVFCQPALDIRMAARSTMSDRAALKFRNHLLKQAAASELTPEQVSDANSLLRERAEPRLLSIRDECEISKADIQSLLGENEAIVILSQLYDGSLGAMWIDSTGATVLRRSGRMMDLKNEWHEKAWHKWRQNFPALYGQRAMTKEQIASSTATLGFLPAALMKHVTIIPTSELFGFPFGLMQLLQFDCQNDFKGCEPAWLKASGFLFGEILNLCTAPSLAWFRRIRMQENPTTAGQRKAWIGEHYDDQALTAVRSHFPALLSSHGFNIELTFNKGELRDCPLAIIVAHGSVNSMGELLRVEDSTEQWLPGELASFVSGSGCVVLGVCHGGHSTTPINSNETWSLVASILAEGTRCVIAPNWSIDVGFLRRWLQAFLSEIDLSKTISEASSHASKVACSLTGRPSDGFVMQVFGDSNFRIASLA